MEKTRVGFALTGSFCTFSEVIPEMARLAGQNYDITPIMSFAASGMDTRFGKASDIISEIETICGREVISTIEKAEPIGPKKLLDILVIAPCTGNTLGKLANGIFDTPVTLAAKSHLRNQRPVIIGVSTNDALSSSYKNIGTLCNAKNIYFVPMRQDAPENKPNSMIADFKKLEEAMLYALNNRQIEPLIFQTE